MRLLVGTFGRRPRTSRARLWSRARLCSRVLSVLRQPLCSSRALETVQRSGSRDARGRVPGLDTAAGDLSRLNDGGFRRRRGPSAGARSRGRGRRGKTVDIAGGRHLQQAVLRLRWARIIIGAMVGTGARACRAPSRRGVHVRLLVVVGEVVRGSRARRSRGRSRFGGGSDRFRKETSVLVDWACRTKRSRQRFGCGTPSFRQARGPLVYRTRLQARRGVIHPVRARGACRSREGSPARWPGRTVVRVGQAVRGGRLAWAEIMVLIWVWQRLRGTRSAWRQGKARLGLAWGRVLEAALRPFGGGRPRALGLEYPQGFDGRAVAVVGGLAEEHLIVRDATGAGHLAGFAGGAGTRETDPGSSLQVQPGAAVGSKTICANDARGVIYRTQPTTGAIGGVELGGRPFPETWLPLDGGVRWMTAAG